MRSTSIGVPSQPQLDRALEYTRQKGQWVRASSNEPFPAHSTARDLLLFARSLESGKLISKALLTEATSPPAGQRYGYGLIMMEHGPIASFGHGGSSAGVNVDVRIVPAARLRRHWAQQLRLPGGQSTGGLLPRQDASGLTHRTGALARIVLTGRRLTRIFSTGHESGRTDVKFGHQTLDL
jgi:hypothetical protein